MKILYVTSEASPYAASGGLGDVLGALPAVVSDMDCSLDAAVILPLYKCVRERFSNLLSHVTDLSFNLSWRSTGASVYSINANGVTYYFVENNYYFNRSSLYGEHDDAERFAFFSLSVVEFIKSMSDKPDILHANDWQSAMSIVYLKTIYGTNAALSKIKTVYTIHNIEYQGKYDPYILGDIFGLENSYLPIMCESGAINLMKAAMLLADKVTTVSPNYACELQHDFFSFGLSDTVRRVSHKLVGIINGIDYDYFSPDKGGDIAFKYTKRIVRAGKAKNKADLLEELSLPSDSNRPLIVMITRLAEQKGIDLVIHIIDELLQEDVNFVILGTGQKAYEDVLKSKEKENPNLRVLLCFDRALSKRLYASADMFLMPSKSEPCGLAQMIACSYGTVPIVRSVGGLCDTIIPYGNEYSNGFRFDNYNAHDLLFTIKSAIEVYSNADKWHELRKRCVNSNFSWERSAANYIKVYKDLLSE